jgi:uncharacterized protein
MNASAPIVDAAVHPFFRQPDDIRKYLPSEWAINLVLPAPWRFSYVPPIDEFPQRFRQGSGWAGSDVETVRRQVLDEPNVDFAVLVPLGRGCLPDIDFGTVIAQAVNRWLAEEWLSADQRLLGSIRINPEDVRGSIMEIERWCSHPQMVQVLVPLQSHRPYGERSFLPIWEAASERGLPVAVHAEVAAGVDYWPTVNGFPPKFIDYSVQMPLSSAFHLASLITEGVFQRIPELKFVFADGGFDLYLPLIWRMDKDFRPFKIEFPWLEAPPSEYLLDHVRFLSHGGLEGPADPALLNEYLEMWRGQDLLLFGSEYPYWDYQGSDASFIGVNEEVRSAILGGNAAKLYRLDRADVKV